MKRQNFITKSVDTDIVDGVSQTPRGKMKVGLYSVTYLGCWYKECPLTWQEVLQRAKKLGFDGVEFDAKRPHANPMDWDQNTRKAVVDYAGELGLELPALAANNNFASPVPEEREAQLLMVKEQIKLAADLGCKSLRVFASWPGITFRDGWANYDEPRKEWVNGWRGVPKLIRWNYMIDCFKEAAKMAGDYGIVLALQNHEPLVGTWRDCLKVVNEVGSPHLKICFDLPPHEDNVENITTAINTIGHLDVLFHYNGEFDRLADGKLHVIPSFGYPSIYHYGHLINELQRIGYTGYLNWEFCHCSIDKDGNQGQIKYVDDQTKLALEYMRGLVVEAEKLYPPTT
jgi:sugar phosphate isomerase/epimerase